LAPLDLPACSCNARCRFPSPHRESGQAAVLLGVLEQGGFSRRMKPTSDACTMPCLSQACLLGSTPSPQQALQGEAAYQAQRHTWLTPNDSPGTWNTRRDYRSSWTIRPFHRTVFTAHTWSALPHTDHTEQSPSSCPLPPHRLIHPFEAEVPQRPHRIASTGVPQPYTMTRVHRQLTRQRRARTLARTW
jgi:hypothetical protein